MQTLAKSPRKRGKSREKDNTYINAFTVDLHQQSRYEWMNEFGRSVESVRPVLLHARYKMNNHENLREVLQAISRVKMALTPPK